MKNKFTKRAEDSLRAAKLIAEEMGHTFIGTEHILVGLISEQASVAAKLLESRGVTKESLLNKLCERSGKGGITKLTPDDMTAKAKRALLDAGKMSEQSGYEFIGTEHLLSCVLNNGNGAEKLLAECGISSDDIRSDLSVFFCSVDEMKERSAKRDSHVRGQKKSANSTLLQYGKNLTEEAMTSVKDPVIGREREINRVITILARRTKNNPLLIGDPGVGKTAIVEGLSMAIANRNVPEALFGKQIICLDIASMIAGAKYRGEFEERLKNALFEAINDRDVILFIDEIHTIIGAGSAEGAMDAANILKPPLARGEIRVIGATTYGEYTKHIERDAALERRFQTVRVSEPSEDETSHILLGIKGGLEKHHGIIIDDSAIYESVKRSVKLMPDRFLPDKAIDVLDEAASYLTLQRGKEPEDLTLLRGEINKLREDKESAVARADIEKAEILRKMEISKTKELVNYKTAWEKRKRSAKPVLDADAVKESLRLNFGEDICKGETKQSFKASELLSKLQERIYGQDNACKVVVDSILRSKIGLRDDSKPISSFLFCGPSGVGKTALARALAECVYGTRSLLKIDMSEFTEKHSISRLIGSPPGYVGCDEPGKLTQFVRNNPESVIVFDGLDRSCREIYGLLLQILDEGVLTDSRGKRAYFGNCLIVATCDISSKSSSIGFSCNMNGKARKELALTLGGELINRFDEIVEFDELGKDAEIMIAKQAVGNIISKLIKMGYSVKVDDEFVSDLAVNSGGRGARGILNAVSCRVEIPLCKMILNGEIAAGEEYKLERSGGKTIALTYQKA